MVSGAWRSGVSSLSSLKSMGSKVNWIGLSAAGIAEEEDGFGGDWGCTAACGISTASKGSTVSEQANQRMFISRGTYGLLSSKPVWSEQATAERRPESTCI